MLQPRIIKCGGTLQCLSAWAREAGIKVPALHWRLENWGVGCLAILFPVDEGSRKAGKKRAENAKARRFILKRGQFNQRA